MDLSIIIVSWQVKDYLRQCLQSIYQETKKVDFEVIVIDNSSIDGTVEMIKEDFLQVNLTSNFENVGFAKAVNQGLKIARGRYLLLLNPDVEIVDQALDKMVAFMNQHSDYAIAGCRLLNQDRTIQLSVRQFPSFFSHLVMMFKLHHLFSLRKYFGKNIEYHKTQEVDQLMGAFFMIRREVLEKVGLFDEKYYLWFEEVDYCLRAKKAGFKVIYTPEAQVVHYGGQSFLKARPLKKQWHFSLSRLHYIKKHSNFLAYLVILILTPISLLLTLIYIGLTYLKWE